MGTFGFYSPPFFFVFGGFCDVLEDGLVDRLTILPSSGGANGHLDGASKAELENEFGTSNEDEVIQRILEQGAVQEFEVCVFNVSFVLSTMTEYIGRLTNSLTPLQMQERQGPKNDSRGPYLAT
jgi:hypothetical protein